METLNQIAFNIRNKLEGGRSTNNSFISLDQVKYNINHYRSLFLRREMRKGEDVTPFEQRVKLSFHRSTKTNAPFLANSYLVSKEQLPSLVRFQHRYPISIYNAERTKVIPVENSNVAHLHDYNRYTRKDARAYVMNNRLYVTSDAMGYLIEENSKDVDVELSEYDEIVNSPTNFYILGVFEFPDSVELINGCDPLEKDDKPYPCSADITQRITEGIINGSLPLITQTAPDTKHNNLPDRQ